jgi:hypothetical protein
VVRGFDAEDNVPDPPGVFFNGDTNARIEAFEQDYRITS